MQRRKPQHNRKVLLAVPLVWTVLTGLQAVASAGDAGQHDAGADAGADGGGTVDRSNICSVAGSHGFGTALGAGCC
jgi:hypothetical protein